MRAVLDHIAVVEDDDAAGPFGRGESVRDEQGRTRSGEGLSRPDDQRLGGRVERCGRLVEQQDVGVDEIGPSQCEELALTRGQVPPPLADAVVVAVPHPRDHAVRAHRAGGSLDVLVARIGTAVRDRVANRAREQERLLRNVAEPVPVSRQVELAQVSPVDQDRAVRRVVEPRDQLHQGRLAGTGLAHQGHGLASAHPQVDAVQGVAGGVRVVEVHVVQHDLAGQAVDTRRLRRLGGRRRRPQQVTDPA